jgi:hypothetical protein
MSPEPGAARSAARTSAFPTEVHAGLRLADPPEIGQPQGQEGEMPRV